MFAPLDVPETRDGALRKVGVELEFGGLGEADVAKAVQGRFGGKIVLDGLVWCVETDEGVFEIYLDTALGKDASVGSLTAKARDLGRSVVPLELVAPPLAPDKLGLLQAVATDLRRLGAEGTEAGLLRGYGMHLNIAARSMQARDIIPVLRAYTFLEDWLRGAETIDLSRRMLPFVDPYPRGFVTHMAQDPPATMEGLATLYLRHNPTRNRGLDLLPILATWNEAMLRRMLGNEKIGARPAFHYRLPDCRIDEQDWTIALEWNRWRLLEKVAAAPDVLDALAAGWVRYFEQWTTVRGDWRAWSGALLAEHGFREGRE